MLEVNNLSIARRRGYYFQNLSWRLQPGELLLVYGARNSGKTQLLEVLIGARIAASGEVRLAGQPVRGGLPLPITRVGYAPQSLGLWPDLTGEETINFFTGYNEQLTRELKHNWQLEEAWRKPVGELEGPLRQRINLAVSLAGNAPLIVWDEPLVIADPGTRTVIFDNLQLSLQSGKTIVLTTAFWQEAENLPVDKVLWLKGNEAVLVAPVELSRALQGGVSA
ncbi:ABC-type multidrug transport system, ATPase component [Carboxydocella sporoproducens DSM 16521]|uniref:ABC-type multidrug transport system, ATPase component n=2 Tax=Carboxydocella TaxID=178898 RepID=A0A1T4S076_9FIRM|nr:MULTISPECIES: ATP-binding cassette domain-containing protein [Carboxydocella]AVX20240.1 ABC-type multidrug transport system, ATPase component [Carboxydocella thermautotrophica]AVX30657.1 ABC-type multidrug transport system, ATPase component [Carboxydocella thermautotrophica]SKA21348.1 ABC-type multidrug transport system, ATPase component [Carboxydocella sporoproducens DSM 16521]